MDQASLPLPPTPTPPPAQTVSDGHANSRRTPDSAPFSLPLPGAVRSVVGAVRGFLDRHHRKLWWLHSVYALGLGLSIVLFANKGFEHARWLAVSAGVIWLVVLLFFRFFGSGQKQDQVEFPGAKVSFFVMTYVLKNLYQGMLFFLLPFYWKASTLDATNAAFFGVLVTCAGISTLDLVFDRFLMRFKVVASAFYGLTLFACLNVVIPALLPNTRTLTTLVAAAMVTATAFLSLHVPLSELTRRRTVLIWLTSISLAGVAGVWARRVIPPAPMHLANAAVGTVALPDGRLAVEIDRLHETMIQELMAVTDVVVPGGKGDTLVHVWRRDGRVVYRSPEGLSRVDGPHGAIRLRSHLPARALPDELAGAWSVDVETADGQLVGRARFDVTQ